MPKHTRNTVSTNNSLSRDPGNECEYVGDRTVGCNKHARQNGETRGGSDRDFPRGTILTCQKRHRQDHRNHTQVLEDQDANGQAAMRRIQFTAARKPSQHNGRAGDRDNETQKHRRPRRHAEPSRRKCGAQDRGGHLDAAAQQDGIPHAPHVAQREFQTDPEEQENNSDLCHHLDLMRVVHQAQRRGPREHTRKNQPRDRRDARAAQNRCDQDRRTEYDDQVPEKIDFMHG